MTNTELLHQLVYSQDPESILVAQDLAMELNCGLPRTAPFVPISHKIQYSLIGDGYRLEYGLRWHHIRVGVSQVRFALIGYHHRYETWMLR